MRRSRDRRSRRKRRDRPRGGQGFRERAEVAAPADAPIRGRGKVITNGQLLLDVLGAGVFGAAALRPHLHGPARQNLEEDPAQPRHLITELQVGYRLSGLEVQVPPGLDHRRLVSHSDAAAMTASATS